MLIKNSGQTPAYDVVHWGSAVILPITQESLLQVPAKLDKVAPATIGPGCNTSHVSWTDVVTAEQIAAIQAGTSAIYVYGKVTYRDAFRRDRETVYRLMYSGNYRPPKGSTLSFCNEGNYST